MPNALQPYLPEDDEAWRPGNDPEFMDEVPRPRGAIAPYMRVPGTPMAYMPPPEGPLPDDHPAGVSDFGDDGAAFAEPEQPYVGQVRGYEEPGGSAAYLDGETPDGSDPAPPRPVAAPAHQAKPADHTPALTRLGELQAQYPQPPKPHWWQRAASATLGAGEGWSNAAGRTRTPFDINGSVRSILQPFYAEKLEAFNAKLHPAEALAKIEAEKAAAEYKQQEVQSQTELRHAQTVQAQEHGAYWKHRAQLEANRYSINAKGQVFDRTTGEIKVGPPTLRDKFQEAKAMGRSDADAWEYASGVHPPAGSAAAGRPLVVAPGGAVLDPKDPTKPLFTNPNRPLREVDPEIAAIRRENADIRHDANNRANMDDRDKILRTKADEEAKVTQQRQTALGQAAKIADNGERTNRIAEINRSTINQLQTIQNLYAQSWRQRGMQTDDYDYSQDAHGNPIATKRGAQAPQGGGAGRGGTPRAQTGPPTSAAGGGSPKPAATPKQSAAPSSGSGAPGANPGGIRLALPNGSVKVFANQAQLDHFLELAKQQGHELTVNNGKK